MENRVKERLTGAIILVAAMVILVPEMFSGHRGNPAPPTGAPPRPATEGPPLRSYTMERDARAPGTPGVGASAPPPVDRIAAEKSGGQKPHAKIGEAAPAMGGAPAQASVPTREPLPQAAPQPAPVAPVPPVAATPNPVEESFYVQVGSFSKSDNAQRYAQEISRKGFVARVDRGGKGNLLRVRVGPVAGRAAALELREQLAVKGYKGSLTSP